MAGQSLLDELLPFVSPHKQRRFEEVLDGRTRHVTVVLEDFYQPHNASAVLRTCDAFGIQDVHIIENEHKHRISPDVALGAEQWLSLLRYNHQEENTFGCLQTLKDRGYRVVVTSPEQGDWDLDAYPIGDKTALVFGAELRGLSETARQQADGFLRIPMVGFTESLNVSVAAAVCLYTLMRKLRQSEVPWQLRPEERAELKLAWARQVVRKHWPKLEARLCREYDA